jgi:hypothetical protein
MQVALLQAATNPQTGILTLFVQTLADIGMTDGWE